MPVDLSTASLVSRRGLVLDDQSLVILESQFMTSRMWRVPYEQVRCLTLSRSTPYLRMTIISVLILLPGLLLLLVQESATNVIAAFLIVLALAMLTYYLVCGKTRIEIAYGQRLRTFDVITSQGRLDRFLLRFKSAVEAAQTFYHEKYAVPQAEEPYDLSSPDMPDVP